MVIMGGEGEGDLGDYMWETFAIMEDLSRWKSEEVRGMEFVCFREDIEREASGEVNRKIIGRRKRGRWRGNPW